MRVGTSNVHVLASKTRSVERLLDTVKPHLLVLTETWLNPANALPLSQERLHYNPLVGKRRGRNRGGVKILFRTFVQTRLLYRIAQQDHQAIFLPSRRRYSDWFLPFR